MITVPRRALSGHWRVLRADGQGRGVQDAHPGRRLEDHDVGHGGYIRQHGGGAGGMVSYFKFHDTG